MSNYMKKFLLKPSLIQVKSENSQHKPAVISENYIGGNQYCGVT